MKIRKSTLRTGLLIAGPLAVLIVGGAFYLTGGRVVETDNAYVKADKVALVPEVKGKIVAIPVTENQPVAPGDELFRIDDAPYRIALAKAEAQLSEARDTVTGLKASYRQKVEEVALARANGALAVKDYNRKAELIKTHTVSASALDTAQNELSVTQQRVRVAEQELAQIVAKLQGNPEIPVEQHALYREAEAARDQARLDLEHTHVRAPFTGIVSQVPKIGAWVDTDSAVMALVSTSKIWIDANFKETDLTHVLPGQPVTIAVDTYPDHTWTGTVDSISQASGAEFSVIPAQNTTGNWVKVVQRIPVRIAIAADKGAPPLRAGMSTIVEIDTGYTRPLARMVSGWFGGPSSSSAYAAEATSAK